VILRISGTADMVGLVEEIADAFTLRVGGASFEISRGGSAYGLESLRRGESDVAMVSWLPLDLGSGWQTTRIARDGLAIIVHPQNPVAGIGYLQLQDLFAGRIDGWSGIDGRLVEVGVQPVVREQGSGARAAFETLVMDGQPQTPRAVLVTSSEGVVDYVAGEPEAVGYVSHREVTADVKALTLEDIELSADTIGAGAYPLVRELWLVTHEEPSPEVQAFLTFVASPAGQEVIQRWQARTR
jgi:phosphate transport system substrate-binding protein